MIESCRHVFGRKSEIFWTFDVLWRSLANGFLLIFEKKKKRFFSLTEGAIIRRIVEHNTQSISA